MKKPQSIFRWIYWGTLGSFIAFLMALEALTFFQNIPNVPRDYTVIFIKTGSTLREISKQLGQVSVVPPWKLRLLARVMRKQNVLKPGEYRFDIPSPPMEVLRTLVEGKVV